MNTTSMRLHFYTVVMILVTLVAMTKVYAKVSVPTTSKPIQSLAFYPTQEVTGLVLSKNNATISAQTTGEIIDLPIEVGQKVNKGQILVKLSCGDQTLKLNQAKSLTSGSQAKIRFYEWQLGQIQALADKNHTSKERVKTYESELAWHKAQMKIQSNQIEEARLQVSRCQVKAPFNGIITHRKAHLGEYVNPGTPLVQLISNANIEVQAQIHPYQVKLLSDAKKIYFKSQNKVYPLQIKNQVSSFDLNTHTQEVRFSFRGQKPLAGSFGTVIWEDSRAHIPPQYITKRGKELGIFLNINNIARFVPLPQAQEGRPVPLPNHLSGLIVIDGRHELLDGSELSTNELKGVSDEVA